MCDWQLNFINRFMQIHSLQVYLFGEPLMTIHTSFPSQFSQPGS